MSRLQQGDMADASDPNKTIAGEQALQIRRLAHDLSNALEIIVQTSFLLGTLNLEPDGRKWLEMLDSGVQQAITLNRELRDYIRLNS